MVTGNKGDWSELYVFAKLLSEGKLYQSDINLNRDEDNCYEVVKVYREEGKEGLEFERDRVVQLFLVGKNNEKEKIGEFSTEYLQERASLIYKGILNGKGKRFQIPEVSDFIEQARIKKLTAKTTSKSDIKLRIYDHRLAKEADLGFSIKSLLGENSTLFNTGTGNNFVYTIQSKRKFSVEAFNKETYKPASKISKLSYRLQLLQEKYEATIKFKNIQSTQLWKNLKMIDGDLPEIMAYCLLYRWLDRTSVVSELVVLLETRDPMNFYGGEKSEQRLYEYKIKKFLAESAMGMTSETPWHGIYDATGGVIICKQDGDIVCFHIYDFNLFREYLLKNTKFEQPSTGEDENNPGNERTTEGTKKYYYGWLYEENGEMLFKINLQVRFN